jgi:RNA polymerase sigma-70 factor (ECF subfamily)
MVTGLNPSDEALTRAVREGRMEAFDVLYARYEVRLFAYVRRFITDRERAEDVFQDVFMTVLRDRTFDPERGKFAPWLFTVARNRCRMAQRKGSRESRAMDALPRPAEAAEPHYAEADHVHRAMEALPEAQRQLLLLKQVAELTYREIAAVLGVAEGTIKSRLHAATTAFRAQLAKGEIP